MDSYTKFPLRNYDPVKDEEVFSYPPVFKSHILTVPAHTFKGAIKNLGMELVGLAKALQADSFVFLGDTDTTWLYQHNDHKPVQKAQQYLTDNKIGKRFNGAIQVPLLEIPVFVKHLAWLIRCNAALPYFHFIDPNQNIVGNICQYGNLHISTLNKEIDNVLHSFISNGKFQYGDDYSCTGRFGKTSAIPGRKTVV